MQVSRAPKISEKIKDRFRAALVAGALLLPSTALAQERDGPPAAQREHSRAEAEEHRHPESERFSAGPIFVLRNTTYRAAGALHEGFINPRAVVPFSSGVSLSMNLSGNTAAFNDYMLRRGSGDFSPRVSAMGLSIQYDHFLFRDLIVHRNEATGREEEQGINGSGHSASVIPSLTIAAGARGVPLELVFYGGFGYRHWGFERELRYADGASERHRMSVDEPYVGLFGLEMRFPTMPCEGLSPVRVERLGVAAFGDISNILAYISFSGNYRSDHRSRLRTLLTPQASNFASQVSVGGELLPIDLTFYLHHGFVSFAPGIRMEYNLHHQAAVLEAFGEARYFPVHQLGFAARTGWIGQVAGHPSLEGEPSSAFGSLNIVINTDI